MKTSNKLLFSFLGFAWVSVVGAMFASVHYSGKEDLLSRETFLLEEDLVDSMPIEGEFSVVSIQNSGILMLNREGMSRIEYKQFSYKGRDENTSDGNSPYFIEVKEDTLFVREAKMKENGSFTLYIGQNIKTLILNDVTEFGTQNALNYDSLKVIASNSSFKLRREHGISFLDLRGDAGAHLSVESIPNLEIHLNQSKADVSQFLGRVSGNIIESKLTLPRKANEINLKKDDSSDLMFFSN
ncbi:hypothetical protein [Belliella pelovolcani]|uniref:Uncharacterized protein n=1 Tax=Belliella pelovolcani TaxID=529505 RepID=A0A1N7MZW4_9BACT|nr:hypothetical protein [Belliella pelovolcani]SIS91471.1 hypothetical protein SAMN05421761_10817 [Belliella pelovolcani]